MRYASLGSISDATHRAEDLLPCFADELESLLKLQPRSFKRRPYRKLINAARRALQTILTAENDGSLEEYDSAMESADDIVNDLQDVLGEFAPPYCYFGTVDGDGADFGFFPIDDWAMHAQEDGIPVVVDGARDRDDNKVPAGYRGEWFHVSDHGNVTLYVRNSRGKNREVWACV